MARTISQVRRQSKLLFRWCMVDGKLDEHRARQVVEYILQSRRRGYLAVLGEFRRLMKIEQTTHTAKVESAVMLQPELQSRLQETIATAYGGGMSTQFVENASLIGGVRIRIANDIYDGSIKSKLVTLASSFGIRAE